MAFDAVVEVRPQLQLAGYGGLRVEHPEPRGHRRGHPGPGRPAAGQLRRAGRRRPPGRDGDHLTIDLKVKPRRRDDPIGGMTTTTSSTRSGRAASAPELDEQLQGAIGGDIVKSLGRASPMTPSKPRRRDGDRRSPVQLRGRWSRRSRRRCCPRSPTSGPRGVGVRHRRGAAGRHRQAARPWSSGCRPMALRNQAVEALVELVDDDPPEPLVEEEIERRAHELGHALAPAGAQHRPVPEATGRTEEQVVDELRSRRSRRSRPTWPCGPSPTSRTSRSPTSDVDAEIARLAERFEASRLRSASNSRAAEQMPAVRSDLRKRQGPGVARRAHRGRRPGGSAD